MEYILIPIRRITVDEILEFVDFVMAHSIKEYDWDFDVNGILVELVCQACLGNCSINVPRENRGLAALIQLKWGKEVDELTSSAKPGE